MQKPCVFFDRDGIVNVSPSPEEYYVLRLDRFFLVPEFLQALRVANERGYAAVIVTNQLCVGKGLITREGLEAIHDSLREKVRDAGLTLLDIYYCPHGNDHPDRKPNPGMLLRAARDHDLDVSRSWMIGDTERDMQAGHAAGCSAKILVRDDDEPTLADHRLPSMKDLPAFLEENLETID